MRLDRLDEKQISQYLLGRLDATEQQRLEERLMMIQGDLFEQTQVLEDELIEQYLKDALSPEEKKAFEKHFLTAPERQQKLKFAQAFKAYVAERVPQPFPRPSLWQSVLAAMRARSPALRYGLAVALLGAFFGCLWMAGTIQRLNSEVAQIRTEQSSWQEREQQLQNQLREQRRRSHDLEQQLTDAQVLSQKPPENDLANLVALALTPGLVRDSGTSKRITISSATHLVELRLELADQKYDSYRAILLDEEGSEILAFSNVKPDQLGSHRVIVLRLPAKSLLRGDYLIKLSGASRAGEIDPLGSYYFRALRR